MVSGRLGLGAGPHYCESLSQAQTLSLLPGWPCDPLTPDPDRGQPLLPLLPGPLAKLLAKQTFSLCKVGGLS